uniref:Uncharacterized protein n=1 Tax=Cacopsylla melanoneura TaxID=428564 RepID=A0A8D8RCA1_9HEMI
MVLHLNNCSPRDDSFRSVRVFRIVSLGKLLDQHGVDELDDNKTVNGIDNAEYFYWDWVDHCDTCSGIRGVSDEKSLVWGGLLQMVKAQIWGGCYSWKKLGIGWLLKMGKTRYWVVVTDGKSSV